ncbi:MraY family glycosyltransferase [Paenibacillus harenae]|uniref:UDP-GlcNAc:undecaprenyl-phosphate GlcNAc-1-phosphate transferase n=1 Tax=Paenibacillus harenae TaxID=306543 RepID=A0ABT9U8F1_PAEHA|nr:MraY family glycosyltransferase [Paenibacillus harenae]MDQ0062092.1 UDP-GlcNAc:undecaprenyl-phosphate GlcNAc-1-phosphate transferase [Paenibacillus harenae]MDQ0115926.1 UDP-GlcNAc:undecaprenyl-phosphate GlcNAc-1-phosphate transferase [Paenibacillus harenae]
MMYGLAALISFAIVFVTVPPLRKLALRLGFVDRPTTRKIHRKPIPLMGGAAIFAGCVGTMLLFVGLTPLSWTIVIGGFVLVAVGLIDDAWKATGREFPVWPRVIIYLAAASVPSIFRIQMAGIASPINGHFYSFEGWFSWLATTLWVFALINMINFIDGVDGLASGVCTLSSLTLLAAALMTGRPDAAMLAVIAAGVSIGFLIHNFYPARIFMGDAGATFLGYTLAVIAVDGTLKRATFISMLVPLLALGLPILDTSFVMLRRLISGKGLHHADKLHTHHTLMKWGLNQVQTVSFLYLISALFALMSIILLLAIG